MTSDDERREVARRLRELRSGWSSGECYSMSEYARRIREALGVES